ncbi:MAG: sulfatase [Candidatus Latescibacteria bacterium]|nr:sulfatase [Candidatus Latescibacterota bacterium]
MSTILNRRDFLRQSAAASAGLAAALSVSCGKPEVRKPNFVFILVDDLGWRDVTCFGSTFYETPNIDKLAAQGMKFTDAYAACPVCSPTRASIMTGKYPARLHLTDWIKGHVAPKAKLKVPDWTMCLDHEEVTIAEALKTAGYVSASVGKWHLGDEDYYPDKQGFDVNIAGYWAGQPPTYYHPYTVDREWNNHIPTMESGMDAVYLTDRLTDESLTFIENNKDRPFFLYLSHYAVHTPIEGKKELIPKYEAKIKPAQAQKNPEYAAMIESVDDSVGRVMDKLEELGIADNTVVIFMSDNGGLSGVGDWLNITSNAPLRSGKGTAYEGGVREPMIIKWPGVVTSGTVCSVPVISIDFYPTMLDMAGIKGDPGHFVDGKSLIPLLKQTGTIDRETIYWHYPHYHITTPFGSVRKGAYKLIEYYEDGSQELYNLIDDIGETNNLSSLMPDKAEELRKMLEDWRISVGAQMMTPNPDYDGKPYSIRGSQ